MTRRSNRKDRLRFPYHINLPLDIRLLVYFHLFHGMICPPKLHPYWPHRPESTPYRCKELELRMLSILRVSKPTREEALPIFEENIVVVITHEQQFMWIQRSCRQARTLRINWVLTSRTIGEWIHQRDLSAMLPALRRVECHVKWRHPITCSNIAGVIENLNGMTISTLTNILDTEVKSKGVILKNFPCDLLVYMSFDILYEPNGYDGPKIQWKTRLQLDVQKQEVVERSIWFASRRGDYFATLDSDDSGYVQPLSEWVLADEVLFVHKGLRYPVLYHRQTGRRAFALDYPTRRLGRGDPVAEMEEIEANDTHWKQLLLKAIPCGDTVVLGQGPKYVASAIAEVEVDPEEYSW